MPLGGTETAVPGDWAPGRGAAAPETTDEDCGPGQWGHGLGQESRPGPQAGVQTTRCSLHPTVSGQEPLTDRAPPPSPRRPARARPPLQDQGQRPQTAGLPSSPPGPRLRPQPWCASVTRRPSPRPVGRQAERTGSGRGGARDPWGRRDSGCWDGAPLVPRCRLWYFFAIHEATSLLFSVYCFSQLKRSLTKNPLGDHGH